MTRYGEFDFGRVRRYPVADRPSKVKVADFALPTASGRLEDFLDSLPNILAGRDLRRLVEGIREARRREKPIIWGFGGHVVKVGLAPILIDLMGRGFVTALATNGSGVIHDFELALFGRTSEDVDRELSTGAFGMAEETGKWLNEAIRRGVERGLGMGEAVGQYLVDASVRHPEYSILLSAHQRRIPCTVHVGVGTDIIHCHPEASGAALGEGSLRDFGIFTEQVSRLHGGGVFVNVGSAVILPEVFLKAVTVVRNAGLALEDFVTANFDFIQHYRPTQNVVRRPVRGSGFGVSITGHHEIMIPLLAALLVCREL
jgi:hypothetical protein